MTQVTCKNGHTHSLENIEWVPGSIPSEQSGKCPTCGTNKFPNVEK